MNKKVIGTESGGKSAYQGDDGRFYDAKHTRFSRGFRS